MNRKNIIKSFLKQYKIFTIDQTLSIMNENQNLWVIVGIFKNLYCFFTVEFLTIGKYKIHNEELKNIFVPLEDEPLSISLEEDIRVIIIETKPDVFTIYNTKGVAIRSHISYEYIKRYTEAIRNDLL